MSDPNKKQAIDSSESNAGLEKGKDSKGGSAKLDHGSAQVDPEDKSEETEEDPAVTPAAKKWWQFWRPDPVLLAMDPKNFPKRTKQLILMTVAFATLIGPISTTIYIPALVEIQAYFHATDTEINGTLSAFTFSLAVFPMFWASFADVYGRRRGYLISFIIYIIGAIGCATSVNVHMFIAFRVISGLGCSSILSNGAGTIADCFVPAERGRAFAIYSTGPLLGPALGPIIGGYLNSGLGWRSNLAFVAILGGLIWLCILFFLPETSRQQPGKDGETVKQSKIVNPFLPLLLFKYTNLTLTVLYSGIAFMMFYLVNTTFTRTLSLQYGLSTGTIGLCYLPLAVGAIAGNQFGGRFSDHIFNKRVAKVRERDGEEAKIYPEMRISGLVLAASVTLGLFGYIAFGWTVQKNTHFAFPLIAIFFLAVGLMTPTIFLATYIVDSFRSKGASATACLSLFRFIMAGIGSLIASDLENALGNGILFSMCGGIMVLLSLSVFYVMYHPEKWAAEREQKG
ncbi:MFS general substrate transporter [Hesseltinella vesiculosa]|uniref:MFS general substrate transporter n=1 Tax=Hesseltinella vesiculosa TaxID=101127 RepID=A0A1X2GD02_9FUNG|nr:MFS general substrate transporter [Hesseltinella vesiculosa]